MCTGVAQPLCGLLCCISCFVDFLRARQGQEGKWAEEEQDMGSRIEIKGERGSGSFSPSIEYK